jgi:hypothetical protein
MARVRVSRYFRPVLFRLRPQRRLRGFGQDEGDTLTQVDVTSPEYLAAELERAKAAAQDDTSQQDQSQAVEDTGAAASSVDPGLIQQYRNMMSGATANELSSMRQSVWSKQTAVNDLYGAILKMPDGTDKTNALAQYSQATAAVLDEQKAVNAAIAKYSETVGLIQTASMNSIQPPQLAGLGMEPVTIAVLAILGTAAVATALYALASLIDSARGSSSVSEQKITALGTMLQSLGVKPTAGEITTILDSMRSKGTLESISGIFGQAGTMTRNLAIAGAVGFGLYILYGFMKKRGKI